MNRTRGEWEFFNGYLIRAVNGEVATPVADVVAPYRRGTGLIRGEGELQANGRLMAAAPDLLAALRELADGVPDDALGGCADNEAVTFTCCAGEMKRAKAAIAKAVGRG